MRKTVFKILSITILALVALGCDSKPAVSLEKIVIGSYPITTTYIVGEKLNLAGLTVEGLYQDETYKPVTDYTTDIKDGTVLDKEGTLPVTISYSGKTAQFSVTVLEKDLQPSPIDEDYMLMSGDRWWYLRPSDIKLSRSEIKSVSFVKTKPEGTRIYEWNVDYQQNGYVKCYVYGFSGNYSVYFVGEKILGNWDSTHLFGRGGSEDFSGITSIDFGHFDTSEVLDMRNMFCGCSALKTLDLSMFDTSSVTAMGYMFAGCSSLTSLELSSFNTSNVTMMWGMFEDCSSLTSLNLSSFNTSEVAEMDDMFNGCLQLASLNISSFNTSKVRSFRSMFEKCSALKSLDLGKFNTSNATDMSGMFMDCSALVSLNISSFNTSKVTTTACMFYGCSSLTSLNLNSFRAESIKDMSLMFYGCSSLVTLEKMFWFTESLIRVESMFSGCSSLKKLFLIFDVRKVENMNDMFRGCSGFDELELQFALRDDIRCDNMFTGCGHSGTKVYINPSSAGFWSKTELGTDTANWYRFCSNVYAHK